jgi:hypothetical protein
MINNNICLNCDKSLVCKIADKLAVFSEDAKKDLGVDITINSCKECKVVHE